MKVVVRVYVSVLVVLPSIGTQCSDGCGAGLRTTDFHTHVILVNWGLFEDYVKC